MTFRGVLENSNNFKIKRLLMIAAQDFLLKEAVCDGERGDIAKVLIQNPEYNAERLANLAVVNAVDLTEESPDSRFTQAISDVFDIVNKLTN